MSWRNKVARCKRIPEGWDLMESTLEEFEATMREAGRSRMPPFPPFLLTRFRAQPQQNQSRAPRRTLCGEVPGGPGAGGGGAAENAVSKF
jgi:hypothetical protein